MTAVRLRFRAELRANLRSWLVLALLAGVAAGAIIAAAAGARRTDSALARHVAAYRFPDLSLGNSELFDAVRALPQVAATSESLTLAFVARDAHNQPVLPSGPHALGVRVSVDGRDGSALERWKLLAGRRPVSNRADEALVDSRAAATLGVRPGDVIALRVFPHGATVDFGRDPATMRIGRLVRLRVVGVKAATDTVAFPAGLVRLTPAFYGLHDGDEYTGVRLSVRLKHGLADLAAFRRDVRRVTIDAGMPPYSTERDETAKIQRSIHLQARALWLAAALTALLCLVLVVQALVRQAEFAARNDATLSALGMTKAQLVGVGVARSAAIAIAAAALGAGVALGLSPLMPIGQARELEPDPGFAFDPPAVGLGAACVLLGVVVAGAYASWRAVRQEPDRRPAATPAEALARLGLGVTIVGGVRLALSRGRGSTALPVGATLVGVVLAVAVAATALTFSASLDHLFATPRLYGQTWDYELYYTNRVDRRAIAARLRRDATISDAALGADDVTVRVDAGGKSREVGARGMDDVKGALPPVVTQGRAPLRSGELLVGAKTLDDLGLHVGETVTVRAGDAARMRVVGRGVVAVGPDASPGEGVAMSFEALRRIEPGIPPDCCQQLQLRFAPGAKRDVAVARAERQLGAPAGLPRSIADFGGVTQMPFVVAALLIAIAAAALGHTLLMAARRRSRELAILKTLGFDRRQVMATVAWQATTYAAVGIAVGLPLGVAAGRWAWTIFARELGVVPDPVTPAPMLLLVVPAAVVLANLVAVIPARMAAGTRPAVVLAAE